MGRDFDIEAEVGFKEGSVVGGEVPVSFEYENQSFRHCEEVKRCGNPNK